MDIFGIQEHDDQHAEMERVMRRVVEQVAQLSIDLGFTRAQVRGLWLQVQGKVDATDVDPAVAAVNEGIKEARVKLAAAKDAAEADWAALNDEVSKAVDKLREELAAVEV